MTFGEARIKLNVDADTFREVLRSCSYTEVKVFDCVKIGVMKKYIKMGKIKTMDDKDNKNIVPATKVKSDIEVINEDKIFRISRKELIEVVAAAYNRGFSDSKNVLPVLTKTIIDEMINEVAVVRSEV